MQDFRRSALVLAILALSGILFPAGGLRAQEAAKTQLYNSSDIQAPAQKPDVSSFFSNLKNRQPRGMQTAKPKTYEELMAEGQKQNEINAAKQFQANQAARDKRFAELQAAFHADVARKQALLQGGGQQQQQKAGAAGAASAPGVKPATADKPPIRVYVRKKAEEESEKPRRLFNVREP